MTRNIWRTVVQAIVIASGAWGSIIWILWG